MKSWRKLTGGALKNKTLFQSQTLAPTQHHGHEPAHASLQAVHTAEDVQELVEEDDSIEDEFRRGLEDARQMRTKYEGLLQAAKRTQQQALEFSMAIKDMASYLKMAFGDIKDSNTGEVFQSISRVEAEVARHLETYSGHVAQTIMVPTESLLNELDQVEETKIQYDTTRVAHDQYAVAQKKRAKNGKGTVELSEKEQAVKEEFVEIAMTLGCRLISSKQRSPRSLLTQVVCHHAAQTRLFKQSIQQLQSVEVSMQHLIREMNINCSIPFGDDLNGFDEEEDETDADADNAYFGDRDSNAGQGGAGHSWVSQDSLASPGISLNELKELPPEMPREWVALLSGLDNTLEAMGADTMDVKDAVFAINAVVSAAIQTGKVQRSSQNPSRYGSFSAPLSSQGTPIGQRSAIAPMPSSAHVQGTFVPPAPAPAGAAGASGPYVQLPESPSRGSHHQPLTEEPLLQATHDYSAQQPSPGSYPNQYLGKHLSFASRSGPILSTKGRNATPPPPPFSMNMSGPLPSPSSVEQKATAHASGAAASNAHQGFSALSNAGEPYRTTSNSSADWNRSSQGANNDSNELFEPGPSAPRRSRSSKSGPILFNVPSQRQYTGPQLAPRPAGGPRLVPSSGPLPLSSRNTVARSEPLHKSGPIGRSPLGSLVSPTNSPPRIAELHKLPPPPLSSNAPASFAPAPLYSNPNPAKFGKSSSGTLKAPPGLASLSLQQRLFSLPQPPSQQHSRPGAASRHPSVPTILSESEEGESPNASSFAESPKLRRSQSVSSSESGASSTIAPLKSEETLFSQTGRHPSHVGLQPPGRLGSALPQDSLATPAQQASSLRVLGSWERDQLIEQVIKEDFSLQLVDEPAAGGVPSVPDWSSGPPEGKEGLLQALATAVLARRSQPPSASGYPEVNGSTYAVR